MFTLDIMLFFITNFLCHLEDTTKIFHVKLLQSSYMENVTWNSLPWRSVLSTRAFYTYILSDTAISFVNVVNEAMPIFFIISMLTDRLLLVGLTQVFNIVSLKLF